MMINDDSFTNDPATYSKDEKWQTNNSYGYWYIIEMDTGHPTTRQEQVSLMVNKLIMINGQ